MSEGITAINEKVREQAETIRRLRNAVHSVIIGQDYLVDRLLIGLITNNHILVEGVPGLAKTLSVRTLAACVSARFQRIQFTPDLLPADIIGTLIYNPKEGTFTTRKGPIFSNIILADEINRAPPKVQSALLEAMQERQVTIGGQTHPLPQPFMVMATQNPIEQEGTYPLPEAQVDRFMLKLVVTYPSRQEELRILEEMAVTDKEFSVSPVADPDLVLQLRTLLDHIYVDDKIKDYVLNIVFATRQPEDFGLPISQFIRYGASPRASIYLTLAAKAHAFLHGRGYVVPQDVKSMAHDVLRHRILVSYEAEAEEVSSEHIIDRILDTIPVP